eukprot:7350796-Pyramimonas_sp.AAC.1
MLSVPVHPAPPQPPRSRRALRPRAAPNLADSRAAVQTRIDAMKRAQHALDKAQLSFGSSREDIVPNISDRAITLSPCFSGVGAPETAAG